MKFCATYVKYIFIKCNAGLMGIFEKKRSGGALFILYKKTSPDYFLSSKDAMIKIKFLIIFICCLRCSFSQKPVAKIVDYKFDNDVSAPYYYRFKTSDGFEREETAEVIHKNTKYESVVLKGSYQYMGADGKLYTINYTADENGFHPEGEHIKVPPYVPWPSAAVADEEVTANTNDVNVQTPKPDIYLSTPKATNENSVVVPGNFYIPSSTKPPKTKGEPAVRPDYFFPTNNNIKIKATVINKGYPRSDTAFSFNDRNVVDFTASSRLSSSQKTNLNGRTKFKSNFQRS